MDHFKGGCREILLHISSILPFTERIEYPIITVNFKTILACSHNIILILLLIPSIH